MKAVAASISVTHTCTHTPGGLTRVSFLDVWQTQAVSLYLDFAELQPCGLQGVLTRSGLLRPQQCCSLPRWPDDQPEGHGPVAFIAEQCSSEVLWCRGQLGGRFVSMVGDGWQRPGALRAQLCDRKAGTAALGRVVIRATFLPWLPASGDHQTPVKGRTDKQMWYIHIREYYLVVKKEWRPDP